MELPRPFHRTIQGNVIYTTLVMIEVTKDTTAKTTSIITIFGCNVSVLVQPNGCSVLLDRDTHLSTPYQEQSQNQP